MKQIIFKKEKWNFETVEDLEDPDIWDACIAPYRIVSDYKPVLKLAEQLTGAKDYFKKIESKMGSLKEKNIEMQAMKNVIFSFLCFENKKKI